MPGSIVHLIVQQRLKQTLVSQGDTVFSKLLGNDPASPYAAFGSIGPDFLFFSAKEYGDALSGFVNSVFKVYDAIEPIIDFFEETIGPVADAIDEAESWVDDTIFRGLFKQLGETADTITQTALMAVAATVGSNVDAFYGFYPKIQQGAQEKDWYWFDFLHYRRTGQFCSKMWELAQGDEDLQRYVIGYASHIGTDVVGHPFVNAIVGGPYRMHWHRHKLVENWIDAYARNMYPDSGTTKTSLKLDPAEDKYVANAISGSYYSRLVEFEGKKLPDKLAQLLKKAMQETYGNMEHPPFLGSEDLDSTYRLWLKWFERSTQIGSVSKPIPVPPPYSLITDLLNEYASSLPSPPGSVGGGFNIAGIFAAILAFLEYLAEVIAKTVEFILTHLNDILTLPIAVAIETLKYFLYLIQKAMYEFYEQFRFMLVLAGYLFPEPNDLNKQPYGRAFLNTRYVYLIGGKRSSYGDYPLKQESHGWLTPEHHLVYPHTMPEQPYAEPAPQVFFGKFPEVFITGNFPYDASIEMLYTCTEPYGNNQQATHFVDEHSWSGGQFGNAVEFSARLIKDRMQNLPNFNLDGDRGYAWKTWRALSPENIETNNPVHVKYVE
ncbi:zinc dependent phospholipase C family protein [Paenibacillus hamazuiensis]|uniref:zinc dependent phospholipase C family protein n=1 Tax=Paenibacillus hamazuiensis TaxID=2936508 RepID=UPI00200EEEB1|nr:zinc dependent phospholipase C family protein [Paenibacillus hamazuiensis]